MNMEPEERLKKLADDTVRVKTLVLSMRKQLAELEAQVMAKSHPHPPELDDYYVAIMTITSVQKAEDWLSDRIKKLEQDNSPWAARTIVLTRCREALKAFPLEENDRWNEAMERWYKEG